MSNGWADIEHNIYLRIRIRTMIKLKDFIKERLEDVTHTHYDELEQLFGSDKTTEQKLSELEKIIISGVTEDMQNEIVSQLPAIFANEMEKIGDEFVEVLKRASERAYKDILAQFDKPK